MANRTGVRGAGEGASDCGALKESSLGHRPKRYIAIPQ
jgi:hypothetical protein